jgi:aminopeptidase Y
VRVRTILLAAAAAALAAAAGLLLAVDRGAPAGPVGTTAATAAAPPPAIDAAAVSAHLRALARIAEDGGTRAAGTPGDGATREHVVATLRAAGWRVTEQQVRFPFYRERSAPRVAPAGGRALEDRRDVRTLAYSPGGRASGAVRPIGIAPGRGSDAGCDPADFAALRDGEIALVQRGTCEMRAKARNAERAGAAAVLIANDGREDRTGVIAGTLGAPGLRIPALFVSSAAAQDLVAAGRATIAVDAVSEQRTTGNVLAETGTGPRVAMAGAHLDSVEDGPGLNDDGSGVAALLVAARSLAGRAPEGATLRLGFWGAEELGLYGSRHYVRSLGSAERSAIGAYVNLDMVGTEGGRMAVYRGDDEIEASLRRELLALGRDDVGEESLGSSSDHAPFARAGIPVGGIFTGIDRCYHRACDDLDNVDPERAADAAAATAATLLELSAR